MCLLWFPTEPWKGHSHVDMGRPYMVQLPASRSGCEDICHWSGVDTSVVRVRRNALKKSQMLISGFFTLFLRCFREFSSLWDRKQSQEKCQQPTSAWRRNWKQRPAGEMQKQNHPGQFLNCSIWFHNLYMCEKMLRLNRSALSLLSYKLKTSKTLVCDRF